jgi:RNA polymerase sigma-B factor
MTPAPLEPLARRREDTQLIRRLRGGDARARETLIERHLPLARALAMRYRRTAEPADDLIQVASVGLIKAADRWDPDRGFAFSTFAVPTILGELRRYFRDHTWDVRPPRPLLELSRSVDAAREELSVATGREPKVVDLAARLGRSSDEVEEALQAGTARHARSLDVLVHQDEGDSATLGELIGRVEEGYEQVEAAATLEHLTADLDPRAREVMRLRFGEDLHQAEIGDRVGCSQVHVSRIIQTSLEKLAPAA